MNIMLMFQVSSSSRLCLIWVCKIYMDFNDYNNVIHNYIYISILLEL